MSIFKIAVAPHRNAMRARYKDRSENTTNGVGMITPPQNAPHMHIFSEIRLVYHCSSLAYSHGLEVGGTAAGQGRRPSPFPFLPLFSLPSPIFFFSFPSLPFCSFPSRREAVSQNQLGNLLERCNVCNCHMHSVKFSTL